jgi:hypothetical protein
MVHSLHHQREAGRPVVPPAGDQPDAYRIAPGHQPVAVVLDLVDPVGVRQRVIGRGREARFDEGSTRHAPYLGGDPQQRAVLL